MKKIFTIEEIEEEEKMLNLFYNIYFPSNKIYCDICEKDITNITRVSSLESQTSDICGICYSNGFSNMQKDF